MRRKAPCTPSGRQKPPSQTTEIEWTRSRVSHWSFAAHLPVVSLPATVPFPRHRSPHGHKAKADLEAFFDHIPTEHPEAALRVRNIVLDTPEFLAASLFPILSERIEG
jgi:hypothetical protein